MTDDAWANLKTAIELLSKHPSDTVSPFHCEHDELWVMSDAEAFTPEEIAQLDELGFFVDDGGFKSFRYGSA